MSQHTLALDKRVFVHNVPLEFRIMLPHSKNRYPKLFCNGLGWERPPIGGMFSVPLSDGTNLLVRIISIEDYQITVEVNSPC